jgi:fluoroquinolone transport system permease protein
MKRLLSTIRWDLQLQFRNGFYYASAFVALVFIVILKQFPDVDLHPWWPAIIMLNLTVNSFYFMSGLVLLEKSEGTLEAQVVTPLRKSEYLISKVITLGILALVESLTIVVIVSGVHFNWLLLILGIFLLMAMYTLYGFVIVSRYDSINEFLLPSVIWTMAYSLPLLYYFDIWRSWILFLHPIQAPLLLMQAAFQPIPTWQIVYGVLYAALWAGIAFYGSQRAFMRFVVRKEGRRPRRINMNRAASTRSK